MTGDGRLELLVSHGESGAQPLSLFKSNVGLGNSFLRIHPLTRNGAPARGATVRAHHESGRAQLQAIDAGSGYLCQQEPVAHFGLGDGSDPIVRVVIRWPNRDIVTVTYPAANANFRVSPPLANGTCCVVEGGEFDQATSTPDLGSIRAAVCAGVPAEEPEEEPGCDGIIGADVLAEVNTAIATEPVVLFAIADMACTNAAIARFETSRIYIENRPFLSSAALWNYFQCKHPEEDYLGEWGTRSLCKIGTIGLRCPTLGLTTRTHRRPVARSTWLL